MSLFRPIVRLLGRNNFLLLLFLVGLFVVGGTGGLYYFEHDTNEAYSTFSGASWAMIVFLASGFDYELPATVGGRITAVLVAVGGVGLFGLFTATITTFLVDLHRRRRHGMMPVTHKGHYLLCGWNHKGPEIVAQLTADVVGRTIQVVLVANVDEAPIDHPQVQFVRGDPSDEAVLERASVKDAVTGIILPEEGADDADGNSLLVTLALRATNPDIYICIEVVNPRHIVHIERAGANEIISSTELAANMLTQAAINHGVSSLYDQILSNRYGHEVYKIPVPEGVKSKHVREAAELLADPEPIILLAISRREELIVNPRRDVVIEPNDTLLVLAERYPSHLY